MTIAIGTLVGLELVGFALLLGFRHHLDGVQYPWPVPVSFFGIGAGVILAATEVHLNGYVDAPAITLAGWAIIGAAGILAFYHYWSEWPKHNGRLEVTG